MTIIDALRQLRDDFKTWATNNFKNVLTKQKATDDKVAELEENKANKADLNKSMSNTTGKTISSLTQTNGVIDATFQDISITESQVSDLKHSTVSEGTNVTITESNRNYTVSLKDEIELIKVKATTVTADTLETPNVLQEGDVLSVTDPSGNIVAQIDGSGLDTIGVKVNGKEVALREDITELNGETLKIDSTADAKSIKQAIADVNTSLSEIDLTDDKVKLSTELKTYYNVGKVTTASGTNPITIGNAGDTLRNVFDNLFNMDEAQPSITQNPYVSCSLSSTESDERGTDISQVSYSITFNDGAYTNASSTGVSMTSYSFSSGTALSTTETSGTLTLPTTYTVGTSSAFSATITANYSDGDVAKTNLGNNSNPIIQITASSCTATPTFSKTAVDYPYYVSSTATTISELSSVTKAKKSTTLTTSTGLLCDYNANAYVWIFIRKGTNAAQPAKTIQAYSDIAKEWGTFLGGTEQIGEITFNKANGKSDTFYAYRTTNVAQAADSATFRLQ